MQDILKVIRLRDKGITIIQDKTILVRKQYKDNYDNIIDKDIPVTKYYRINYDSLCRLGDLGINYNVTKFSNIKELPMSSDKPKKIKHTIRNRDGKQYKGYKFRLYPNKRQKKYIFENLGCCRKLWNVALKEMLDYLDYSGEILDVGYAYYSNKPEYIYLKEADSTALLNTMLSLKRALEDYRDGKKGAPSYKRKFAPSVSFTVNNNRRGKPNQTIQISNLNCFKILPNKKGKYKVDYNSLPKTNNTWKVKLPKLPEGSEWIEFSKSLDFDPNNITSATITYESNGTFYISFKVIYEPEKDRLDKNSNIVGMDLGIDDYIILDNEKKYDNIRNELVRLKERLTKEQSKLSLKYESYEKKCNEEKLRCIESNQDYIKPKVSNNYIKQRKKVARIWWQIRNKKQDYMHKVTTKLVRDNQVIVSESLDVKKMLEGKKKGNTNNQTRGIHREVQNVSWGETTRQLNYKSEWYGREYIKIDRYFPSSQLCNECNYKNPEVKDPKIREWTCPLCGAVHDRDINAAINIRNKGLDILISNAFKYLENN